MKKRIHVSEREIDKEKREHPWLTRKQARRVVRDHKKKK